MKSRFSIYGFTLVASMVTAFYSFWDIGLNIVEQDEITRYDELTVQWINHLASEKVTNVVIKVTQFGALEMLLLLWMLVTVVLAIKKQWRDIMLISTSTLGGTLLMFMMKSLFHRERPLLGTPIIHETGYSFPSGHTTIAMCFYGSLAWVLLRHCEPLWLKALCVIGLALVILLIGLSRVYLGVHYPSDVLGGFCLGLFWISLCLCVEHFRPQKAEA